MASNITLKISADVQQAVNGIQSVNQKLNQKAKHFSFSLQTFRLTLTKKHNCGYDHVYCHNYT